MWYGYQRVDHAILLGGLLYRELQRGIQGQQLSFDPVLTMAFPKFNIDICCFGAPSERGREFSSNRTEYSMSRVSMVSTWCGVAASYHAVY